METLTTAVQPEFVDIHGAAMYTGYAVGTLYNLVHGKQIPYRKGKGKRGKLSFSITRLREWMQDGEQLPTETKAA